MVVFDPQVCQVSTWAIQEDMFFILHTVPVAVSADSQLVRHSELSLPETLNIQVVTRESESRKSSRGMVWDIVS